MANSVQREVEFATTAQAEQISPAGFWRLLYLVGLVAFVLLNVGDVITTIVAIERGSTELNPLVAPLLNSSNHTFVLVKLAAVVAFVAVFERSRRRVGRYLPFQVGSLLFLCTLYLLAVCINLSAW